MGPRSDRSARGAKGGGRASAFGEMPGRETGARRRAFSLPELMIALVILGLGLLIIAAALPVGLEYNKQSADLANGAAGAEYAHEIIRQNVRLSARIQRDVMFRPRTQDANIDSDQNGNSLDDPEDAVDTDGNGAPDDDLGVNAYYEPLVKVRNLPMFNIDSTPGVTGGPSEYADESEELIGAWLQQAGRPTIDLEFDSSPSRLQVNPALSALSRVYPPVWPDNPRTIASFFPVNQGIPNNAGSWPPTGGSELPRAARQRLAWTAFYRRVAYPTPGPDGQIGTADDIQPEPNLYEVIVVVTRRPTADHQFLVQNASAPTANWPQPSSFSLGTSPPGPSSSGGAQSGGNGGPDPSATALSGRPYRSAPSAWLVWFDALPTLTAGTDYDGTLPDRPLYAAYVDPPTLTFQCSTNLSQVLPVGSVFIPALNDSWPSSVNPTGADLSTRIRYAGFVPHAPNALPIYRVIARPDDTTVVVENNGYYPWVATGLGADAWPVWIIPPAVRVEGSQTIFERTTPIVAVERRFVRFREAP